ncbi:glycosyltransferase [Azospirillum sp. TSO22-1]|uniref:glycosyltransferase family 2 protein n=1 Tax=Azospirillum sp. TSO22-1 TaxID=716789 RepID=UPI001304A7ED|nr:glycosyltransferase [Azospirillum sp. TSO22-1]
MTKISVALPVYNASANLRPTLDSLVAQSHRDFDVVVHDDASQDDTLEILEGYSKRMSLKIIHSSVNLGISDSRNKLLDAIDAPMVAILDHDDICHPTRLERQAEFLEANRDIDICGSAIIYFSDDAEIPIASRVLRHPAHDAEIKTQLLYNTSMVHPSAMARRSFFADVGSYDAKFSPAEDYAMWCRAALLGKRFANLEEPLLYYRVHSRQTSNIQAQRMVQNDIEVKRLYIRGLLHGALDASLAELLCPYLRHSNQAIAAALPNIVPVILALNDKVPCRATYAKLIGAAITRNIV